ncbi:hypothetical protein GGX14DRAFT_579412 [Mycena pura]|uniref:Uncharacterized protein n=1 Tax=Mycena pura TaxID=153505 RepID=A0AAD6US71_9AGAR|nr:hypothetical protein GGX14DRAFT_579412 [Mycena pura]
MSSPDSPIYWVLARVCDPPYHPARDENAGLDGVSPPGMLLVVYDGAQPGLYTNRAFALRSARHAQPLNEVVHDVAAAYHTWHANCFLRHTGEFHHLHSLHTHEQPMEDRVLYSAPISEEELNADPLVSAPVIAATSLNRYVPHPDAHSDAHSDAPDYDLDVFQCARGEAPHPDDVPAFRMRSLGAEEQGCTFLPTPCHHRHADLLALQQRLEEQLEAPPSSLVSDEVATR